MHVLYYLVSRLNPMLLLCLFFKSYILVGNSSRPILSVLFFRETTGVILWVQLKFGVCLIPIEDVGTALFCFVRISPYA